MPEKEAPMEHTNPLPQRLLDIPWEGETEETLINTRVAQPKLFEDIQGVLNTNGQKRIVIEKTEGKFFFYSGPMMDTFAYLTSPEARMAIVRQIMRNITDPKTTQLFIQKPKNKTA